MVIIEMEGGGKIKLEMDRQAAPSRASGRPRLINAR